MNLCLLMVEIIQEPQLRHTPDGLELTEMVVQFQGLRAEDPPATLRAVGWGNLAKDIHQNYHQGDRVLIEGRLSMNTIPHQEGYKEKRAELTVQKIHSLGTGFDINSSPSVARTSPAPVASVQPTPTYNSPISSTSTPVTNGSGVLPQNNFDEQRVPQSTNFERNTYATPVEEQDPDDIPF
ncbi:single-stranded DNA-binding protein [Scytonema hofmannii PCC 7110]|uniref:Single-stranded DNA-binding protein n=1 Tax=Scytonema hofmannii PCC 7110 TaxID=128403 RepID=A0A139XAL2_9CYAN|nr:single-stranded DNA-binding protein [Scytonema hofmannii]KYC41706.1 single-stranded DNA-binding protein [Scytonema hofmannii PCC 7110]